MTEELFSTPFAAEILLCLKDKEGCTEKELREQACNGKSSEAALEILTGKGLTESRGGIVRLTSKGEEVVDVLSKIEKLLVGAEQYPEA